MFSSQFSLIFDGKTLGIHSCIRHKIFHLIRLTATHINSLLMSTRRNEQNGKQKNHFEFHYQYKYWHWSECDIICFCIQHNRFPPNQQPEKEDTIVRTVRVRVLFETSEHFSRYFSGLFEPQQQSHTSNTRRQFLFSLHCRLCERRCHKIAIHSTLMVLCVA